MTYLLRPLRGPLVDLQAEIAETLKGWLYCIDDSVGVGEDSR